MQRPDPHDLAVLHVYGAGNGAVDAPAQTQRLDYRLVHRLGVLHWRHAMALSRVGTLHETLRLGSEAQDSRGTANHALFISAH